MHNYIHVGFAIRNTQHNSQKSVHVTTVGKNKIIDNRKLQSATFSFVLFIKVQIGQGDAF